MFFMVLDLRVRGLVVVRQLIFFYIRFFYINNNTIIADVAICNLKNDIQETSENFPTQLTSQLWTAFIYSVFFSCASDPIIYLRQNPQLHRL